MGTRFLLVKPTALGDVAQTCLLVPAIKQRHPDWHVSWVTDADYVPFVSLCEGVDEVIPFPRKRWKKKVRWGEIWKFARQLSRGEYDIVLDLQGLARSALMTRFTGAKCRVGLASSREFARCAYTEVVSDDPLHAVGRYRKGLEQIIGPINHEELYKLKKPTPFTRIPGLLPSEYIVLHPYSMWETKLWPWERYIELVGQYPNANFVLIGSGESFPFVKTLPNMFDLRNQTSIEDLVSILGHAKAVVGTDSGPAHLAAAFGVPTVTLFGATDYNLTAPMSGKGIVVRSNVTCSPCLVRECPEPDSMSCMRLITVKMVARALESALTTS